MKSIFITGVSRGAGRAYAEKFLNVGWQVIGTSTTGNSSLVHENLEVYSLDLSNSQVIADLTIKLINNGT
jgi:NAD(P)-dependent dehydrogenase (short-subunit alcohol dehydrogenase family)